MSNNTQIFAVYFINGKQRGYIYNLDDINDVNHFFDDEDKLLETFILTEDTQCEESKYFKKISIEEAKKIVLEAENLLNTIGSLQKTTYSLLQKITS